MKLEISSKIILNCSNDDFISAVKKANTFKNPKYESNSENGYSNWKTTENIETYKYLSGGSLSLPRGFLSELLELCNSFEINPTVEDLRSESLVSFPILKDVVLRSYQERAVELAMKEEQGSIIAPTGSGKSILGLEIIRRRGQKALILVHRSDLAKQWIDVIQEKFGITAGLIGDGSFDIGKEITVGMIQTLYSKENEAKSLSDTFGLILVDEGHHLPAESFFDVIGSLKAKFLYCLTATPTRRDGLEKMIYRAIGDKIAVILKEEVEDIGATVPVKVIAIQTGFKPSIIDSWNDYLKSITHNAQRNTLIIDLARAANEHTLILVDRVEHAEQISEMMTRRGIIHVLAHGKIGKKDREGMLEKIRGAKITIGTTGILGEGLDIKNLAVLIMGSPISSEIKLLQAIGRITRSFEGKENAIAYDLKDDCGFSGSSFNKRFEIYKKNKIWVEFNNLNKKTA